MQGGGGGRYGVLTADKLVLPTPLSFACTHEYSVWQYRTKLLSHAHAYVCMCVHEFAVISTSLSLLFSTADWTVASPKRHQMYASITEAERERDNIDIITPAPS